MNTEPIAHDISDLLSADKGYTVKRVFLSANEADAYRLECEKFLATSTAVYRKIHRYSKHDYIWSEDGKVVPGLFTYRIYQSLTCKHSKPTEEIFQRMLTLRDRIESTWLDNEQYKRIRQDQYDYAQVELWKAKPRDCQTLRLPGQSALSSPPMFALSYATRRGLYGRRFDPIYEKRPQG